MDAAPASADGHGFDAALKALEELETSVVQTRDEKPVVAVAISPEPASAIDFSEPAGTAAEANDPVEIVALPPFDVHEVTGSVDAAAGAPVEAPVARPSPEAATPAAPPAGTGPGRWARVTVCLALFSSIVSAAGLIVAERTIVSARLVVADARERQQQLEQANRLIDDLRLVRDRQIELLRAQQAQLAATPVTSAELQHRMEALQAGIIQHDPVNDVVKAIQQGQADTNARFAEFAMKMARVEAAIDRR